MIPLSSITTWLATHGTLRKSQRTTIAALAWALMPNPVLGIAAMGRSVAMAGNTTAKHAIKRVNRFLGNGGVDLEVACGDLIRTVVGGAREVVLTWDGTDPKTKDSQFQTLRINLRAHGRALPLLWKTVRKTDRKGRMREYEEALCAKAAALLPAGCQVILGSTPKIETISPCAFPLGTITPTWETLPPTWQAMDRGGHGVLGDGQDRPAAGPASRPMLSG